jgi:AraC family transcriptional activator of tynA and feaB
MTGGRAIITSYSTAKVAPAARLAYWNDLHRDLFMPMEVLPLEKSSFEAELRVATLGDVGIVRTFSRAATIEHNAKHVQATAARNAIMLMPIEGALTVSCYGRDSRLDEGDFVLSDSFATSTTVLGSDNQALLLTIPYKMLAIHAPHPDVFFGRKVLGSRGFGHTINTFVRGLWTHLEQGLPPECGSQIANSLLALVATACALEHTADIVESSLAIARRMQIKRYIELHLRDPDLSAVTIAGALCLSPRYIRMVFAAEHEHVSAYVLRRRLEECAKQLVDRRWMGRSITETAFDWGFTNTAYFTRAFKQQLGETPTGYRRRRGADVGGESRAAAG